jgi:CelD/BcsL family acetyltransferase involved in cellulose biosynthesis
MKIETIEGRELTPDLCATWAALQRVNDDLVSPFFHPDFTRNVARATQAAEVAIIHDGARIVGFFPFERTTKVLGGRVGGVLSDYHGIVSADDLELSAQDLLRACRLDAWRFCSVPASQRAFSDGCLEFKLSPVIDLKDGYEAYVKERNTCGTSVIKKTARQERQLCREVGPVRYVAHETDNGVLERLFAWKSSQYSRLGTLDVLALPGVKELLQAIHKTQTEGFAGVLSALYADDRLIAAHLGMRSWRAWHYWFPCYDRAFAKYSPGSILLLKMAESASSFGVEHIDLGAGDGNYKHRFANRSINVTAGCVDLSQWRAARRRAGHNIKVWVRGTPLYRPAKAIKRFLRIGVHGEIMQPGT